MAAGALSIRLDISFCPAGKLAGSSCASPKTLTKCSSNSCHNSLNASCFPAAALQIPGGMCVPRLSVVSTISVMLRGVCSPELGTDRQTDTYWQALLQACLLAIKKKIPTTLTLMHLFLTGKSLDPFRSAFPSYSILRIKLKMYVFQSALHNMLLIV